jgi:hypothetical protein
MIAIDTNILVYAAVRTMPQHARASAVITGLVETASRFAVPWPCVHEFLSSVTNLRRMSPPMPMSAAMDAMQALAALPHCAFIGEGIEHLPSLETLVQSPLVTGPRVHDARIAAICLAHGVTELWTADRDFSYFPRLRTRNPLVG